MDRWGPAGPPEDACSRVTRDLAVVYAGLPAALDAHLERLVTDDDATLAATGGMSRQVSGPRRVRVDDRPRRRRPR